MGNCIIKKSTETEPLCATDTRTCKRCKGTLIELANIMRNDLEAPDIQYYCRKCKVLKSIHNYIPTP